MRNVVLVTKIEGHHFTKCFVDVDKIEAVEVPVGNTFNLYFNTAIWKIPAEEYDNVMRIWASYYKDLEAYKQFLNANN